MSGFDEAGWSDGRLEVEDVERPELRQFLESLDGVTATRTSNPDDRGAWKARCPAHHDKNPSLGVIWRKNDNVSITCFAGCSRDSVLRAAGVDKAALAPRRSKPVEEAAEAIYEYRDESGTLIEQVCRFPGKQIRSRRPDGKGGWIWRRAERRVPYRLPEVLAAVVGGRQVVLTEGEKDADRLVKFGFCASTNPGGAGKWRKEYTPHFAGADIVLMQDNDIPGADHVAKLARALGKVAKSIRIVLLPGLPPKGDVSDWLDAGNTVDELRRIIDATPVLGTAVSADDPTLGDEAESKRYVENDQGLWKLHGPDKPPQRLANFIARITRQLVEDDGVEQKITLEVETTRAGKTKTFLVTAAEFEEMRWPGAKIDARASITPYTTPREVSYVIRLLSREMTDAVLYTHTGWRRLEDGTHVFLHRDGAIGPNGPVAGLRVRLEGPLSSVAFGPPPSGEELRKAVQAALSLLRLAPSRVMIPLLAAAFRAPLGRAGFSIHLFGPTGIGKTQLAVLVQQFFGAEFNWDSLPGSWTSTANAIEGLLFLAKDIVTVVDDFNPRGAQGDVQRSHQIADRVFRGAANVAGRARMDRDASLRPVKASRTFLLSTGEEMPTGHSLAARILLIEVAEGEVRFDNGRLQRAQDLGKSGQLAACMSAFLQFHARDYDAFRERQSGVIAELRLRASHGHEGYHRRTPDATANGMLGWLRFLEFAVWAGAISEEQRASLEDRGWHAFGELASLQRIYQAQENQARLFVALISEAVQGELGHLSTFDGEPPADAERCGWRREPRNDGDVIYRALGPRIGFVDDDHVYLIKNTAYRVAQDTARGGTHSLNLAIRTLGQRLLAEKLQVPGETRGGKNYAGRRKTLSDGRRESYWMFDRSVFGLRDEPEDTSSPGESEEDTYAM